MQYNDLETDTTFKQFNSFYYRDISSMMEPFKLEIKRGISDEVIMKNIASKLIKNLPQKKN